MQAFLVDGFLPFIIVVIIIVAWAAWLTRLGLYFGFRYRDWKKGLTNPLEKKETMGLPKGAMRTFLALTFTAIAALALLKTGLVSLEDKKWILLELGAIVTFYFGSKSLESYVDSRAKMKAIEKAQSTDDAIRIYKIVEDKEEEEKGEDKKEEDKKA
jgi:hypothetical protein